MLSALLSVAACTPKGDYEVADDVESKDLVIKSVEVKEAPEAQKLIEERKNLIMEMLEPTQDPYMGTVMLPEKCRKENLPAATSVDSDKESKVTISIYSSDSKNLGHCPNPEALLKTQYVIAFCKKAKKLFYVTYYYSDQRDFLKDSVFNCL